MNRPSVLVLFALLLGAWLPSAGTFAQARPQAAPVAGVDYVEIADARPWRPLDGRIEVVEVFAYGCHHCRDFQAHVDRWTATLPKHVRFSYVPAAFDPQDSYARAFFAAEALRVLPKTHHATFRALHDTQALPARGASADEIAAYYAGLGVDARRLKAAMHSPATNAKMNEARDFAIRTGIEGTPTIIINGRYRVRGRSLADILRITDALVARERRASGTP
jgi:protein dithiol oxidoreductase (disulfide-forming)